MKIKLEKPISKNWHIKKRTYFVHKHVIIFYSFDKITSLFSFPLRFTYYLRVIKSIRGNTLRSITRRDIVFHPCSGRRSWIRLFSSVIPPARSRPDRTRTRHVRDAEIAVARSLSAGRPRARDTRDRYSRFGMEARPWRLIKRPSGHGSNVCLERAAPPVYTYMAIRRSRGTCSYHGD